MSRLKPFGQTARQLFLGALLIVLKIQPITRNFPKVSRAYADGYSKGASFTPDSLPCVTRSVLIRTTEYLRRNIAVGMANAPPPHFFCQT